MERQATVPFLKWAGGKRWFVANHSQIIPQKINHYYEPFLGSGAVYFYLQIKNATLSDINGDLINLYTVIRDHGDSLKKLLNHLQKHHSEQYYYKIRNYFPRNKIQKASIFLYLNITCWNGLYRVNKYGIFNVPIGTKTRVLLDTDDFKATSQLLQGLHIVQSDFEEQIDKAGPDDFVFADPPYTVKHNHNNFVKYNENIFSWADQERLRNAILRAKKRGAKILLTNAAHESVEKLYDDCGSMTRVSRQSVISGDSGARQKVEELVIRTWA